MISLDATIGGVPVFYAVPVLVFGPILIWVLYSIGVGHLFKLPSEIVAKRKREQEERRQLMEERRQKMGDLDEIAARDAGKRTPLQYAGQALVYALLAAPIAYCSNNPTYQLHAPNEAQVKLSLSKPGKRKNPCERQTLSREELAKLPPQRRGIQQDCGRERWPVLVQVAIDGERLYRHAAEPSGLSNDGPSLFYERFTVPAGSHELTVKMRLDGSQEAFDHSLHETVTLEPQQNLVVTFNNESDSLVLR